MRTIAAAIILLCATSAGVAAQSARVTTHVQQAAAQPGAVGSFAAEAVGGVLGAALGFSAIVALDEDDCGDDVTCSLRTAGSAVLMSTVGAAIGTWAAGQMFETEPSGWGAVVGSIAGAAAALGMDHLVAEEMGVNMSTFGHVVVFSITQGVVTAIGSRIGAALR